MSALDTALHGLRALIADGALRPGDKLPSEGELCDQLGVSRGSVREAIRMLAALGVLETRHGSGSYVSTLRPADLIQGLSLTVDLLPLDAILELVEIRRPLEAHAAAIAAARADDETLAGLTELVERIADCTDDDEASRLDHEFHMRIADLAGNAALTSLLQVLRSRTRQYRIFDDEDAAQLKDLSDAGHRAIARGLVARDPAAASAAAAGHVAQTEYWLRKQMAEEAVAPDVAGRP
ncbi:FadR/GntR family transcriptional regulator [Microbacterium sp. ASV81]|uniref:GntR family transcriptional regulator n=1 Tax=Microbacterium capsulatum TaxID=3041921 RepID=A0ABU0XPQ5_9MICO|nr:FCD domain-containing protein [Microbacterium sp. ASV81]MDQ4215750.1 GntR family transcriptional regulator [Microbacterium sp. ASV81]